MVRTSNSHTALVLRERSAHCWLGPTPSASTTMQAAISSRTRRSHGSILAGARRAPILIGPLGRAEKKTRNMTVSDAYANGPSWILPRVWPTSPWQPNTPADKIFKELRFLDLLRLIAGLISLALLGTFIGVAATHAPGRACPSSMDESACAGVYCGVIIGFIFPTCGFIGWTEQMHSYYFSDTDGYEKLMQHGVYADKHNGKLRHPKHGTARHAAAAAPLLPTPPPPHTKAPFAMMMYPPAF